MALSVSQKVVVGAESTYAASPSSSTDTGTVDNAALPIESVGLNLIIEPFNDQTKRGAAGLDSMQYPTVRRVEGDIEGPLFTDEAAYFLLALLGKDTVATGASNQNTHAFQAKTNFAAPAANSLTIDVRDDVNDTATVGKSFVGLYVSSFTLRFSAAEGIMTYTASFMGQDAETSYNLGNVAFAEPVPIFGWTGTFNLVTESRTDDNEVVGASVKDCAIIDAEFTFNRPTSMLYALKNSQLVCRADPGPLEVTARFTIDWDNSAGVTPTQWFGSYTSTGTTPFNTSRLGMRFDLTNGEPAGNTRRMMRIYLPSVSILEGPLEVDRSDTSMRLNLSGRALNNTAATITGPVKIKLTSRRAAIYGA